MNVIPTEGKNLYLPPVWERFLAVLEMTKNLNCYLNFRLCILSFELLGDLVPWWLNGYKLAINN